MAHDRYISPFSTRYASDEMQYTFSDDNKFRTWRRLWIALAKAEQKQGLDITDEQIAELEAHKDDINYEEAIAREKLVRHDVMSHVYAYGLQCPKAKGIIHLGATSCYVGDNTDVIIMREGLQLVRKKLIGVLANLADFAEQYKDMPCLAYTHCQPAQLTTVGKRAALWMNEFYMDLQEIDHQISQLALRGVKGTTGTQASFIELFNGDSAKVKAVEADVCAQMGFDEILLTDCGFPTQGDLDSLRAVEEKEETLETFCRQLQGALADTPVTLSVMGQRDSVTADPVSGQTTALLATFGRVWTQAEDQEALAAFDPVVLPAVS